MANRDMTPLRGAQNVGWPALEPLFSFRQQIDRLFDDFLTPASSRGFMQNAGGIHAAGTIVRPNIELKETDKTYVVAAELPGMSLKDVQVELRDNVLTIAGEKRDERSESGNGVHYSERSFGRFERRIPLEVEVDPDKVEARFENGVLSVELPKSPRAQENTRHIAIKPH